MSRVVLYAEVPCFYAAVERADDAALQGRPVIVGGDPRRRGVVTDASLEARAAGVASGMTVEEALQRCPRARALRTPDWQEVQAKVIREVVKKQEAIGLEAVTDGEFSRDWWHLDFLAQLEGVTLGSHGGPKFDGTAEQPPVPTVTGKLRYSAPIMVDDFAFLKGVAKKTAKFTIPSPSMLHLRAGRKAIAYEDMDEFYNPNWSDDVFGPIFLPDERMIELGYMTESSE